MSTTMTVRPIKSNIENDLKHGGAQFANLGKAILELVWNSIQYQPKGQHAIVDVKIAKGPNGRLIIISDNGRGMDDTDLDRFFTLHSDNLDRTVGDPGRGKFGFGAKQAIMGLGCKHAYIHTVKGGVLYSATWRRADPTNWTSTEPKPTSEPDGTKITLTGIQRQRVMLDPIRSHLKLSIGRLLLQNVVRFNSDVLTYEEPEFTQERVVTSPEEMHELIGEVKLTLRVAKNPLPKDIEGVVISVNDVAQETGFLGSQRGSQLASKIYGFVDVPLLESVDDEEVEAYTSERSMKLNSENLRVQALQAWIDTEIAFLIKEVEQAVQQELDKEREEQLQKIAKNVSTVFTDVFSEAMNTLDAKLRIPPKSDGSLELPSDDTPVPIPGDNTPSVKESPEGTQFATPNPDGDTKLVASGGVHDGEGEAGVGGGAHEETRVTVGEGDLQVEPKPTGEKPIQKKLPRGKITFDFSNKFGGQSPRANWNRNTLTLLVNMEAPELVGKEVKDPLFLAAASQIAATEFAVVLTEMNIEFGAIFPNPTDSNEVLVAVRESLEKIGPLLAAALKAKEAEEAVEVAPTAPVDEVVETGE